MKIFYTYSARNNLVKLPRSVQKRIAVKMRFYVSQKNPLKFARRLINPTEGMFRFRIGDYRVIFDIDRDNTILVLKIMKRDKVYA